VKQLTAKEAGYAMQLNGYTFLDVRPSNERNKVCSITSRRFYLLPRRTHIVCLKQLYSYFIMGRVSCIKAIILTLVIYFAGIRKGISSRSDVRG
jgi:hypothetical protein